MVLEQHFPDLGKVITPIGGCTITVPVRNQPDQVLVRLDRELTSLQHIRFTSEIVSCHVFSRHVSVIDLIQHLHDKQQGLVASQPNDAFMKTGGVVPSERDVMFIDSLLLLLNYVTQ